MENIPNIDNDHHIVSNLFLMLLGEQCDYTYKSTDGIFHLQQVDSNSDLLY
jgi:hypothetical protein